MTDQQKLIRKIAIAAAVVILGIPLLLLIAHNGLMKTIAFLLFFMGVPAVFIGGFWLMKKVIPPDASPDVRRGSRLSPSAQFLQQLLDRKQAEYLKQRGLSEHSPRFTIAGIRLPNSLEDLGFFMLGSPGSGKTQAIAQSLDAIQEREDFRCVVFDRNGEFTERFFRDGTDLLFNPTDARSVSWSHRREGARPETIAGGLIPDATGDEKFFTDAAKALMADLYERCDSNAEIWEVLSSLPLEDLTDFLKGGLSHRFFISEKTGGSVLSTAVNFARFYRELPSSGEPFSFSRWSRSDDPRSLFLPLFEEDSELFKPLYSMAFELILKGLLSEEGRPVKTAIIIDELGALNQLRSLTRLVSESRKFGGCPVLGTQAIAQVEAIYGDKAAEILLQGTATKLLMNCRDPRTAEVAANLIGKQEKWESTYSQSGFRLTRNDQIREVHAVMPSEIQALPQMQGYLLIGDGTPTTKIQLQHLNRPVIASRLEPRSKVTSIRRTA